MQKKGEEVCLTVLCVILYQYIYSHDLWPTCREVGSITQACIGIALLLFKRKF